MLVLRSVSGQMPELVLQPNTEGVLGRGEGVVYRVDDTTVSRRHAALKMREDMVLLTDLGSANGSFINGAELKGGTRAATPGDVLQFGNVIYSLVQTDAAAAPPSPSSSSAPSPVPAPRSGNSQDNMRPRSATVFAPNLAARELAAAARVQAALIHTPPTTISAYEISQFYQPARTLSGDFLFYATRASGELWAVLGDVCGKGAPAGRTG